LKLITASCATDRNPIDGVSQLKFTITGDDIAQPIVQVTSVESNQIRIPAVPVGAHRKILVEGITSAGGNPFPIAAGESEVLDLDGGTTGPIDVVVFLRRVDAFSPTVDAADPAACTEMTEARAAHTATLIDDGRVLIAGGFEDPAGGGARAFKKTIEFYDPKTGKFTPAVRNLTLQRAFHTASLVPSTGHVVIAGGEFDQEVGGGTLQRTALKAAEIVDPKKPDVISIQVMDKPRTRHSACVDKSGRVLLAGGYDKPPPNRTVSVTTEFFDPTRASAPFVAGPALAQARAEHACVTLSQGQILLIGGVGPDSQSNINVLDTVAGFIFVGTRFEPVPDFNFRMSLGRTMPQVVRLPDETGNRLIVSGGFLSAGEDLATRFEQVTSAMELITPETRTAAAMDPMVSKRAGHCAVAFPDGTVVQIGGVFANAGANATALANADVITPDSNAAQGLKVRQIGSSGNMRKGRYLHACTVLQDGTALVTGGITFENNVPVFLKTAEVFRPVVRLAQ
jgi:hypothetical protein